MSASIITPLKASSRLFLGGAFFLPKSDFRDREIPSSIPNLEVKPLIADDTIPVWHGKVGHCLISYKREIKI